jgi:hypothetical protein
MTEQARPTPPSPGVIANPDTDAIAAALATAPEERTDLVAGPGVGFPVHRGEHVLSYLEIYDAGVVRLTTPTARVELIHQSQPTIAPEGVVFVHPDGTSFFSVSPEARVTLHLDPLSTAPESPPASIAIANGPTLSSNTMVPLLGDSVPSEPVSQDVASGPERAEQEPQERVRLAGRLGTDIRYRTTRNGTLIAAFPLAIEQEDGSARWQEVKVFGKRAARLQADQAPRRGQAIDVIGYLHRRERTGKDGTARVVEEIYAVAVTPR